ncbi:MAG: GIY-YIG nuclease family protein [Chlorobi bacterium]|nr:GIY-YIG nuclease family protein [Chlorobiota bacterium]
MQYYVYVLQSESSGLYYKGQTNNVSLRLEKHNKGYVKSTKAYRPWKPVFFTTVETRSEAVKLERKLKNLKSRTRLGEWIDKNKGINKCPKARGAVGPEKQ